MNRTLRLALALALLFVLGSCSSHESPTSPAGALLRVTPGNGATAVTLDAALVLDFRTAVDRTVVEQGVHLIAESDMNRSCPDPTMVHGSMDAVMADPMMLRHLDLYHSTAGHYSWNSDGTVCTFHPDSLMHPQTRYMVHMSGSMLEMMRGMGGMMGGGYMNRAGDVMTHFQTTSAPAPR